MPQPLLSAMRHQSCRVYVPVQNRCGQPDGYGGRETRSPRIIVSDADALYARAKTAGATIVLDLADQDSGGRGCACRDPEGHLWWFGSYDPWRDHSADAAPA